MTSRISGPGSSGGSRIYSGDVPQNQVSVPKKDLFVEEGQALNQVGQSVARQSLDKLYSGGLQDSLSDFLSPPEFDAELYTPAGFGRALGEAGRLLQDQFDKFGSSKMEKALQLLSRDSEMKQFLNIYRGLLHKV